MTIGHGNDNIRIPFTTYDVFGYLTPGAFFLIATFFFDRAIYLTSNGSKITSNLILAPFYLTLKVENLNIFEKNIFLSVIAIITLIVIAYIVGHIISSASSYLMDKLLVERGHGYPYQKLLQINNKTPYEGRISELVRGTFFWLNVYLLLQYTGCAFGYPIVTTFANILVYVVIVYSAISLVFLWWEKHLFSTQDGPRVSNHWLVRAYNFSLKYIYSEVYDLIILFYTKMTRSRLPFDEDFRSKYVKYFTETFNYSPETARTNNYWFAAMYIHEKSRTQSQSVYNWLSLYSFARNLAVCLFLIFIYMFISIWFNAAFIKHEPNIIYMPYVVYGIFIIMLTRYNYLYKNYYSKFIFRSFVFLKELEKTSKH